MSIAAVMESLVFFLAEATFVKLRRAPPNPQAETRKEASSDPRIAILPSNAHLT